MSADWRALEIAHMRLGWREEKTKEKQELPLQELKMYFPPEENGGDQTT